MTYLLWLLFLLVPPAAAIRYMAVAMYEPDLTADAELEEFIYALKDSA